jgi:hypothetical protein
MRDAHDVRTTLDLDGDILLAAKELAALRRTTAGRVISDLVRQALRREQTSSERNGVPVLPRRDGALVTMARVNELRDAD